MEIGMVEYSIRSFTLLLLSVLYLFVGCHDRFNASRRIPSYANGSNVIAFSNTPYNENNEIYLIHADGSGLQQLTNHEGRDAGPAWSPDATRIAFYVHYDTINTWSIFVMDADGSNMKRLTNTQGVWDHSPTWSPGGTRIAFGRDYPRQRHPSEIWVMDTQGSHLRKFESVIGSGPEWSPDGSQIAFHSNRDGNAEIYIMNSDGSNQRQLTDNNVDDWWPSWSPDGDYIVFQSNRDGNYEIYKMNSDGINPIRLTDNPSEDAEPDWSPDGTQIAFSSFRDGRFEIYVMNSDGSNQRRLTNIPVHNIQPDWRPFAEGTTDVNEGLYLGQKPPDLTPEVFAPGIVSTNLPEFSCCVSPDAREIYFTRWIPKFGSSRILFSHLTDTGWTEPEILPQIMDVQNLEPTMSPDGSQLFFGVWEYAQDSEEPSFIIQYFERRDARWTGPLVLGYPFNKGKVMYLTVAHDGTAYTSDISAGRGSERLVRARKVNGQYADLEPVGSPIDTIDGALYPCIAPDQSFLLFTAPRISGDNDGLFISFLLTDSTWSNPVELVTGFREVAQPWITLDGKYIFFTVIPSPREGDIYWVDARIIEQFKPDNLH